MVLPIMMYGAEVWGYNNPKLIEKIQLRFCKFILHVKRSTPNAMVLGELGEYPLALYIKIRMISFWLKLSNATIVNCHILCIHLRDVSPWITQIQSIFNNAGFQYVVITKCWY